MTERRALGSPDGRHPYQRIADVLRGEIEAGKWPPGTRLPSTNELRARFNVARMTIRSAVSELRRNDLVEPRHGLGVFVRRLDEPSTLGTVFEGSSDGDDDPVTARLDDLHEQVQDGFATVLDQLRRIDQRLTS